MSQRFPLFRLLAGCGLVAMLSAAPLVRARGLEVVANEGGDEEVVVAVYAADGSPLRRAGDGGRVHVVDQVNKRFVPELAAITVGDSVNFPNSDDIRHHVYSFSPAKTFELPLYHGVPAAPVVFDVAGKVALGCNIHDTMSATIYVLDTAVHAVTRDGMARFDDLPEGDYRVAILHPRQQHPGVDERFAVHVGPAAVARLAVALTLAPPPEPVVSALEARFRALRAGH